MKNKHVIALVLSLVIIVIMCSSCQTQNSDIASSAEGDLVVSVFLYDDSALQIAADLYEEKTGIKVDIQNNFYTSDYDNTTQDTGIYTERIISELMSGSGADIYDVHMLDFDQLGENGLIVDMSSWLESNEYSNDTMFSNILLSGKTENGIFAVPTGFVYREMCATSDEEPIPENTRMTWREFFDQLSETGYAKEPAYYYTDIDIFMERFIARTSDFIDENKNVQNLDSAEMVSLLEECRDWRDMGLCRDSSEPAPSEISYSYIYSGISAKYIADALCTLPEEYTPVSYFANPVSPMPYDGEPIVIDGKECYPEIVTGLSYYAVNAGSPNAQAAQEFLQFILSEETQAAMAVDANATDIPINRAAFRTLVEKDLERVQISNRSLTLDLPTLIEEAESKVDEIAYIAQEKPYYDTIIKDTASQFFLGQISADEAAEQMANKVDLYLKEQGY